MKIKAFT